MSELEFALSQIGGAAFETFAMDFLRSQGYDVHESGNKGRDGGWDARVEIAGQVGIAHVSVRDDWRNKLRKDAEKVENLEKNETEDYDIFVFTTNQHISGEQELKIQSEIANDYGWTLKILHKNNILGELRESSPELAERHLDVGVGKGQRHLEKIERLREEQLDKIQNREGDAKDIEDGPVAVLHVIPTTVFSKSNMLSSDFPTPSLLDGPLSHDTAKKGKKAYQYEKGGGGYAFLRNDGLYESAVSYLTSHVVNPTDWR